MSAGRIVWTNIELESSSRKRRALLFVPETDLDRHNTPVSESLVGEAAAPAVSEISQCEKKQSGIRRLAGDAAMQAASENSDREQKQFSERRQRTLESKKPLLIAFHGGSGQAEQMEKLTGFMKLASEENFFVVYPEGVNRHWNDGRNLPHRREIDDVEFLVALVDHLCQSYPIDRQRVYGCGISNGGFFAQYLAARAPGLLAAIASVAATVHEPMYKSISPLAPVPIMFVVGKDDPVIPFAGGEIELASRKAGFVVSAEDSFRYWAAANHAGFECEEEIMPATQYEAFSDPTKLADLTDIADHTRVLKRSYSPGNGKPVVVFIIEGGGHAWPGGWQYYREKYIGKPVGNWMPAGRS